MDSFIIHKRNGSWVRNTLWKEHCNQLPDGRYEVRIKSTKSRSINQNQYYWSVVVPMVYDGLRAAGFDAVRNKEDAHTILKSLFLKVTEERNGVKIEKVLSTTELTTIGFSEYLMNIFTWAFDYLNISIPEPNQELTFNFDE